MKTLVLASFLGTAAGAFVLPAVAGPVHFQVTQPFSLYEEFQASPSSLNVWKFGPVHRDFVITDVLIASPGVSTKLTVNGQCMLGFPTLLTSTSSATEIHLNTGIFIRAGCEFAVESIPAGSFAPAVVPVTILGYIQ